MSPLPPPDSTQSTSDRTPIVISPMHRRVLLVAGGVLLLSVVAAAPSAVAILLGGVILTLLLRYPFEALERFMPRKAALALVLLLLALTILGAALLLVPPLIAQLDGFGRNLPNSVQRADTRLHDAVAQMVEAGVLPSNADTVVVDVQQELLSRGGASLNHVFDRALSTVRGAFGVVIQIFGVVFVAAYLLLDTGKLKAATMRYSPVRYRDDITELWEDVGQALSRYLVSLLVVATIQGTAATLFLWLLGVPYPMLLGIWIAATSTIPYIGTWFGGVPAIVMAALVSPLTALLTFALFFASTTIIGNIITPRVQGEAVRVHPVLVLLAVVAAGEMFGVLGVFLAVPALAIGRVLFDFFRARLDVEDGDRGGTLQVT